MYNIFSKILGIVRIKFLSEFFCVAFTRFWFIATSVPSVSSSHNAQNKKMLVKRRGVFAVQKTKMNFDQILSVDKLVKFIYSEKAPKFGKIVTLLLSYVVWKICGPIIKCGHKWVCTKFMHLHIPYIHV